MVSSSTMETIKSLCVFQMHTCITISNLFGMRFWPIVILRTETPGPDSYTLKDTIDLKAKAASLTYRWYEGKPDIYNCCSHAAAKAGTPLIYV